MQEFSLKTEVFFGENALDHLLDKDSKCAFIVADPFTVKSGLIKNVTDRLDATDVPYLIYDDVVPDPPMDKVIVGVQKCLAIRPDCIMAVGGGSAIDFTEALIMFAHRAGPTFGPPFVAIPTTSGTGSEVTEVAVITDPEKKTKYPLVSEELIADVAILDAELVKTVPKKITADTGMDIIPHAIEAFVSTGNSEFSDALAERAIKLCCRYLCRSYLNANDMEARGKIHVASCMAGMAFANAFLGINHSLAHKLGAFHHLPHGIANALVLTDVMKYNSAEVPTKMGTFSQYDHPHTLARYAEIADCLNLGGNTDEEKLENLIKAINDLNAKVGIKETIKDYGIDEKDFLDRLDDMVEQAFDDQCTGANPRYPLMSEIKQMYLNAYYGKHFVEPEMPDQDLSNVKPDAIKTIYRKGKKA